MICPFFILHQINSRLLGQLFQFLLNIKHDLTLFRFFSALYYTKGVFLHRLSPVNFSCNSLFHTKRSPVGQGLLCQLKSDFSWGNYFISAITSTSHGRSTFLGSVLTATQERAGLPVVFAVNFVECCEVAHINQEACCFTASVNVRPFASELQPGFFANLFSLCLNIPEPTISPVAG